jgi:hypothetical protein
MPYKLLEDNAVVNSVGKQRSVNIPSILTENETIQGKLRPDLVIVKKNKAQIMSINVPFENGLEELTA